MKYYRYQKIPEVYYKCNGNKMWYCIIYKSGQKQPWRPCKLHDNNGRCCIDMLYEDNITGLVTEVSKEEMFLKML